MNSNQKAIRKGYNKIAKALGSTMGVYRPSDFTFVGALDPRNWLYDIPFSATINSGYQSTMEYGVPSLQGFFDSTTIKAGDLFSDGIKTFFVGDIPLFEPPMVIECFNTFSVSQRVWDKATRTHIDTIKVNEAPCNVQSGSDKSYKRDPRAASNPDSQLKWTILTWLPDGLIAVNDKITLNTGKDTQVVDVFKTQHGLTIKVVEILGDYAST